MSIPRASRSRKRQLGQFMTPAGVSRRLVAGLPLKSSDRVLEPSMGDGSFLLPLIDRFVELTDGSMRQRLDRVLRENIFGVEIDPRLHARCLSRIEDRWGYCPTNHHLVRGDFFRCGFRSKAGPAPRRTDAVLNVDSFDYVIGNPPFGGTIDPRIQDALDAEYGFRGGEKIKKETYSFFIVRSLDLLKHGGRLVFICSDTFLTIRTMRGLRRLLMECGTPSVYSLRGFSDETDYPTVVLDFAKAGPSDVAYVDGNSVTRDIMDLTGNSSWRMSADLAPYFDGPCLGDYFVATSGMTIGKNDLFLRPVLDGRILEPYDFEFFDDPVTLDKELARARLGRLSARRTRDVRQLEARGATKRNVRAVPRSKPLGIDLPHPDYCYYNKAVSDIVYAPPSHVVYWKDDGDAVRTYKSNGNWYLRGVGGAKFFGREGLTWQLISDELNVRYLPSGYILDSGAPCAFPREETDPDELYLVLAWTLTPLCGRLLKRVINHTRTIQGKDFERLPYPHWLPFEDRARIVASIKRLVARAVKGRSISRDHKVLRDAGAAFDRREHPLPSPVGPRAGEVRPSESGSGSVR
jgi:hypothetical protein